MLSTKDNRKDHSCLDSKKRNLKQNYKIISLNFFLSDENVCFFLLQVVVISYLINLEND